MTRILILDDQATNRSILRRLAEKIDTDVEARDFSAPPAALGWLQESGEVPDLVVTDFNMPEMNGAEFVRAFRLLEDCGDVPIIVVTAYEDRANLYEALEAGATDFLLGPVDHREFAIRARNLLNLRRQKNMREAAERASEAKTAFLANMSHELRTPLNAIIGFSDIMQREMLGPLGTDKYREYAHDISSSAKHLRDVIQETLDLSRIEQGKLELNCEQVDIIEVLESALRMVDVEAAGKDIRLIDSIGSGNVSIWGDRAKLGQVFINLLYNAVKFTERGGDVEISLRSSGAAVEVAVRDTGIGMAADEIAIAISRFGQVSDDPHRKRYQGAGLGLPISIGLVEMHGGELSIESEAGSGTTVTVRLPVDAREIRASA